MKLVEVENRNAWRDWLAENHNKETEIWLVFYKKGTGKESVHYEDAVEEALCFGWIDSIIKKIDEKKYVRKFTPRNEDSKWSQLNIKRVEKMIKVGLMTDQGLKLVQAAKENGSWANPTQRPKLEFTILPEFEAALNNNTKARETFDALAPTYQKQYLGWIEVAKREETRKKRILESIRYLERGEKLGLK
jgi:uncharacterized protein YdeI (YjbR/CyaY-like superfamily)